MLKKPGIFLLLLVLLFSLGLTGCSTDRTQQAEQNVLRLAGEDYGYPSVYSVNARGPGYTRMSLLFDTLVWQGKDSLEPMLAESWERDSDNNTWTFKLRKDAQWHDQKPLTAHDVAFTYQYFLQHPAPLYSFMNKVKSVDAIDEYTVKITTNSPYAPFLRNIAGTVPIIPEHIWSKVQDPLSFTGAEAVIGSGPFTLEEYNKEKGTYIYRANEKYYLGVPVVDKLVLVPGNELIMQLKKNEVDGGVPNNEELKILEKESSLKNIGNNGLGVTRVYFNINKQPLFAKKELRQALYYAINRKELIDRTQSGLGMEGVGGFLSPSSEWYWSEQKQYAFNPDQARQILDSIGLKDTDGDGIREKSTGEALQMELLVGEKEARIAELIQKYWQDIGIKLVVRSVESKVRDSLMGEGKFEMAINGHGGLAGDPVIIERYLPQQEKKGEQVVGIRWNNWKNDEFANFLKKNPTIFDQQSRLQAVYKMQGILAEELPTLPLFYSNYYFVYNPQKLDGWFYTPGGIAHGIPGEMNKMVFVKK